MGSTYRSLVGVTHFDIFLKCLLHKFNIAVLETYIMLLSFPSEMWKEPYKTFQLHKCIVFITVLFISYSIYVFRQIKIIQINYKKKWKRYAQLVQYSTWIVTFMKMQGILELMLKIHLYWNTSYERSELKSKILILWKMCASTTKLNLSLNFQIITEDVQTLLEVIKTL